MTVTFTATDECGLTANTSFTFTITDTTPPVLPEALTEQPNVPVLTQALTPLTSMAANHCRRSATDLCGTATIEHIGRYLDFYRMYRRDDRHIHRYRRMRADGQYFLTFTITDTTPPVLSGGANGTAECTGSDPSLNAAYQTWRNSLRRLGYRSVRNSYYDIIPKVLGLLPHVLT